MAIGKMLSILLYSKSRYRKRFIQCERRWSNGLSHEQVEKNAEILENLGFILEPNHTDPGLKIKRQFFTEM